MPAADLKRVEPQQSGSGVVLIGRTLFNSQDYNPDMNGALGISRYERIRRDPEVASCLDRIKRPVIAANWGIEPPEKGNKKDEMVELCERYVMGVGSRRSDQTFKGGLLPHVLLALDFGVSALEKVWGVNEKGQQVYARLAPILPQSIREFEVGPLGECERLVQYAYTNSGFQRTVIPDPKTPGTAEEKIAVFTYRKEGDNFFGRAMLREVFQAWFHKSELWTLDGLQKERNGMGLTVIKIPQSVVDTTSAEYVSATKVAYELRAHERQGAVIGDGWELNQIFPTGTAPDIKGSMEYCDSQIARALGAEFIQLGNSPNGTRSLGDSKIDHFMLCLQGLTDMIEEFVNTQIIPVLIKQNYGPQEEYPRLQCEDLDKMSGKEKAEILKLLHDAGMIKYDRKMEEVLREENDFPEIDEATREEEPSPLELIQAKAAATANAPPPSNTPPVQKAAGPRALLPHEVHVDVSDIASFLDQEPNRIWHRVIEPLRADQIKRLSAAAAGASDEALAWGDLPRVLGKTMASELTAAVVQVYRRGRVDVARELSRQRITKADDGEDEDIQPKQNELRWVKWLATGFVASQLSALITEAKKAGQIARNADLSQADTTERVMDALKALSEPSAIAELAGTITRAYQNGRNEQAKAMRDQIDTAYYSAVMDQGTCPSCAALDGAEHDLGDSTYDTPNMNCDWPPNCRCITVYVARDQAA